MVNIGLHNNTEFKVYGGIATVLFHGLLIIYLLLNYTVTPIPPYPEGGGGPGMGVEVNLGFSDVGAGSFQPAVLTIPDAKKPSSQTATDNNIITQDMEETHSISTPVWKKTKKNVVAKDEVIEEPAKPIVNTKALYKKGAAVNQGITKGEGDQGKETGTPSSLNYTGNGTGGGSGSGSGGGTGDGSGTGTGSGAGPGKGIFGYLEGRSFITLPVPKANYTEGGIVVVAITVNRDGVVTDAIPGVKGTTIYNSELLRAAKEAAMKASIQPKKNAPLFQKGTIRYEFRIEAKN